MSLQAKKLLKCQSQSAIRHKVRKLRAKVRSIIPIDVCETHLKRNQQVQKMNFRRTQQLYFNRLNRPIRFQSQQKNVKLSNSVWKLGTLKQQQWYIDNNNHNICTQNYKNYDFSKLKEEQIELINEDKIYYLGEKNIQAYNNFLKTLKSKIYEQSLKRNNLIKSTRQDQKNKQKINQTQERQIFSYSLWNDNRIGREQLLIKNRSVHKSRFTDTNFYRTSHSSLQKGFKTSKHRLSTTSLSKFNMEQGILSKRNYKQQNSKLISTKKHEDGKKIKTPEQKRQFVQQEQKQKRMYQKLKMDIDMAKVQSNQREIKNQQILKIKQHQDHQRNKIEKVVKKRSILMKKGQVAKIGTELRSLMIRRRQNNVQQGKSTTSVIQNNTFLSSPAL